MSIYIYIQIQIYIYVYIYVLRADLIVEFNNVIKSKGTSSLPHPTPPHPHAWRSINTVIKSKGTSSLPPPHPTPMRGVASTT